ncbi:MAG: glutamate--cysteine ligase, partial [Pusillimonas sp.]|nr:glutamate--cysteine ligase [Pusillimonas sp.]
MSSSSERNALLRPHTKILTGILRGIEKEGLRVDEQGKLALTPHPSELGSALTHPKITTDYAEALLELITETHGNINSLRNELCNIHRFVAGKLAHELIWNQSMPPLLPSEPEIPIAWYGPSNTGMLKHVYRRGLAERYGKAMQCIAGVHYNFSVPDALWSVLNTDGQGIEEIRSRGYLALIRNFTRYSWLLMYLFGASPAVSENFLLNRSHQLNRLDADTFYLPHATSLRMSDLGYNSKAQSELELCYNDIETFLKRMHDAVTTPWPPYQAIGTHRDGNWIQLNTNLLQIENEYYSSIRPKRAVERGERPSTALAARGVQYIEVRCLDIDPECPIGISTETCAFMDTFLLFCAAEESPMFPDNGFCRDSSNNFSVVAKRGREPGLKLIRQNKPVLLSDWGHELLERMAPYAEMLDLAYQTTIHVHGLKAQKSKVDDANETPSGRLLMSLKESGQSLQEFTLAQSRRHHETLTRNPLPPATQSEFERQTAQSLIDQINIEKSDSESFEDYVERYHAALKSP